MISRLNGRHRLLADCDRAGVRARHLRIVEWGCRAGITGWKPRPTTGDNPRTGTRDALQRVAQRIRRVRVFPDDTGSKMRLSNFCGGAAVLERNHVASW